MKKRMRIISMGIMLLCSVLFSACQSSDSSASNEQAQSEEAWDQEEEEINYDADLDDESDNGSDSDYSYSSSSGDSATSTSGCQFKYPNGEICGLPVGSHSPLCDYHFKQLNDTYNYVYNRLDRVWE